MLKRLLFAGGAAWLFRKFTGGGRRSADHSRFGSRRGGLRW